MLVEQLATGGQAGQSSRIENYLGFPDGVSDAQLTDRARRQATKFGAEVLTTRDVIGLEVSGSARRVTFADGASIDAHTVILATGVSYRRLGAPGLDDLTGRGVYYGSALTEASACLGQDIYVVGGANSAGQAAVYLARHAKSVTILVRGSSLEKSMSYYLVKQIADIPNISVRTCTEVIEASGEDHLEHLTLRSTATGVAETVDAQLLFLFIGAAPLTDWLDDTVVRDGGGGSWWRARTSARTGHRGGSWTGCHTTWKPASPAYPSPGMRDPSQPSGFSRRRCTRGNARAPLLGEARLLPLRLVRWSAGSTSRPPCSCSRS